MTRWHLGHCSRAYLPTSRGFDTQYGILTGTAYSYNKSYPMRPDPPSVYDFHQDDRLLEDEPSKTVHQSVWTLVF